MSSMSKRLPGRPKVFTNEERRRNLLKYNRERARRRIDIGDNIHAWNAAIKEAQGFKLHCEVAAFLIEIAATEHGYLSEGIELPDDEPVSDISKTELHRNKRARKSQEQFTSFVDPFNVSIDVTQENIEEDYVGDEDYEPEVEITLSANNGETEDVTGLDMVLGQEESEDASQSDAEPEALSEDWPGITHILSIDKADELLEAEKVIVFHDQLIQLANTNIDSNCPIQDCNERIEITSNYVGSAIFITWECSKKHLKHKWCSQSVLNRGLNSGDLLFASSILASGNNFCKIELMSRFLHLHIPSKSSFHRIQTTYLVPAIDEMWETEKREVRRQFQGQEVVVLVYLDDIIGQHRFRNKTNKDQGASVCGSVPPTEYIYIDINIYIYQTTYIPIGAINDRTNPAVFVIRTTNNTTVTNGAHVGT